MSGEILKGETVVSANDISDGYLKVPDGPGLGVEVNESYIKKHPYKPVQIERRMSTMCENSLLAL